jgi:hypothetical protein
VKETKLDMDVEALELEWRSLYRYAWADFTRLLLGWMPTHQKLNSYSNHNMERILNDLKTQF